MNPIGPNVTGASTVSAQTAQGPLRRDNSTLATEVAELFRQGRQTEAVDLLNEGRQGQPEAVQDALDRMVRARLGTDIIPTQLFGSLRLDQPSVFDSAARINQAGTTAPSMPDVTGLTEQQKFDVYSSIVETRGNQAANDALANGDRIILGLRTENSSMTNQGRGEYNDRLVVLSRGRDGVPHVEEFNRVSTESTAQYDGNQRTNPNLAAFRRAEGTDVTGDRIPELGRLREGTTELLETTHHNPAAAGTNFSLRPTNAAVAAGANRVERDSNHDTFFNQNDVGGITNLNNTFKIHSGSRTNTDSAGCTTIHPADFAQFERAATANANQNRWQYVLTTTQ